MSKIATVIIPCGPRHVHLLPRAIRSARAQTIPVDVLWHIDLEQRGPAYGRNRLAEQVTTPYLITLDADDYLYPTFVERTLSVWEPGSFVYTNWVQDDGKERQAISCYGFKPKPGEAPFFLPPTLFPSAIYAALGGQDETLFGAEDTDFYYKANAEGIQAICLREPLLHYTSDGFRAREAKAHADWKALMRRIMSRYRSKISMGCCGKKKVEAGLMAEASEGEMLVVTTQKAALEQYGRVTGKYYGWQSSVTPFLLDRRDFDVKRHKPVEPSAAQLADPGPNVGSYSFVPSLDVAGLDLTDKSTLEALIARAGVTIWAKGPHEQHNHVGYGIQQTPAELAEFITFVQSVYKEDVAEGLPLHVLEIGTGNGGLARFFVDVMGWEVTSIDKSAPPASVLEHLQASGRYRLVLGDSQKAFIPEDDVYDVVFIDAGHTYAEAKADWERFSDLAPITAMHDIAPDGWYGGDNGSAAFWLEQSRAKGGPLKGQVKKGYYERVEPMGKQGIGWYLANRDLLR